MGFSRAANAADSKTALYLWIDEVAAINGICEDKLTRLKDGTQKWGYFQRMKEIAPGNHL